MLAATLRYNALNFDFGNHDTLGDTDSLKLARFN